MTNHFKAAMTMGVAAVTFLAAAGAASAQTWGGASASEMREIARRGARSGLETGTRLGTNGRYDVSSQDRRSGRLVSPAHNRGASDFVPRERPSNVWGTTNYNADAAQIARRLGTGHTVVVERTPSPISGSRYDRHTTFKRVAPLSGVQTNSYSMPRRATGTHIHVQPNYRVRPSTSSSSSSYRSYSTPAIGATAATAARAAAAAPGSHQRPVRLTVAGWQLHEHRAEAGPATVSFCATTVLLSGGRIISGGHTASGGASSSRSQS